MAAAEKTVEGATTEKKHRGRPKGSKNIPAAAAHAAPAGVKPAVKRKGAAKGPRSGSSVAILEALFNQSSDDRKQSLTMIRSVFG